MFEHVLEPCNDMLSFLDRAVPMLFELGIFIHKSPVLMTKVARVCAVILAMARNSAEGDVMDRKVGHSEVVDPSCPSPFLLLLRWKCS